MKECTISGKHKAIIESNDLISTLRHLIAEWDYEKNVSIKPEQVSQFSNKKISWMCRYGHSWQASVRSKSFGAGYPYDSGKIRIVSEGVVY